jgi:hypothetical protein
MKIKFILMMLLASNAFAHGGEVEGLVHFFTGENKSAHEFRIHSPNLTNDRVERGRRISNGKQRDCIAFTFDYTKDDGKEVIKIAKAIKVEQQFGGGLQDAEGQDIEPLREELSLTNVKGTFVYFIQPEVLYLANFRISTRDGNTFTENFKGILGEEASMNLSLEYRRGCLGVL